AQLAAETSELKQELAFVAGKILLALLTALLVSPALGLYLYVIGSLGWGLYKNLGFLTSFLVVPFVLLALVFAPGPASVTGVFGLLAFIAALCWDCNDVYKHVQSIRSLKRQIGA
ncbi:MAG: hypothetical protein Q4F23_04445, partial [Coriobacteriia bacterium]|nr:hypothetical protein [Coriobacteriia bacterium]